VKIEQMDTAVDMEQTEYYSGNRADGHCCGHGADGILQWK